MTDYYDIVLGLIPASFAGLTAVFLFAGLSLSVSIPLASMAAVALIYHALFVNAPTDEPTPVADAAPVESAAPAAD